MLKMLKNIARDRKKRSLAMTAGGVLALMGGRKVMALTLAGAGLYSLERVWREENGFEGTWSERWKRSTDFYEETHQDETNRQLHIVGIPIILAGTYGLFAFKPYRPLWTASLGAFTFGWVLNFIGHGVYEKAAPAFADDPLSFVAGPVWDFQQLALLKKNDDGTLEVVVLDTAAAE